MKRSAPAIVLEPRASALLRIAITSLGVLAVVAIMASRLPPLAQGACALGALAIVLNAWRQTNDATRMRLALQPDGTWSIRDGAVADRVASLHGAVDLGALLSLELRESDGRTTRLMLLPDSADPETLRRLRVWLRDWRGEAANTPET